MDRLAPQSLLPAAHEFRRNRKFRDGAFSAYLLIAALLLLFLGRNYGTGTVRHWLTAFSLHSATDALMLLLAVIATMLVHEGGHFIAAVLFKFHVFGFVIGPIHWQRDGGEWNFKWRKRSLLNGSVSAMPSAPHWRNAMLAVIAAGPIATLLGGLLMAQHLPGTPESSVFQFAFVQVSALLFVLGLIPNSRYASQQNDARLLLDLAFGNAGAEEMELKVLLKQQSLNGVQPQDYPHMLLVRMARFQGRVESELLFAQAMMQWAIDVDSISLADEWDQRSLSLGELCNRQQQVSALATSACFDVMFRNDLPAACSKFKGLDFEALSPAAFQHRARATEQIAFGHLNRVSAYIIRAQYTLPLDNLHYAFERSLLARLHMYVLLQKANSGLPMKANAASAS